MSKPPILPPPPRHVPTSLLVVLALRHPLAGVGWLIVAIGGLIAGVFVGMSEPLVDPFGPDARRAVGRVVAVARSGATVDGQRVLAVTVEWPADAPTRTAVGYVEGDAPAQGAELPLSWLPGEPPRVRVDGMRTQPFPAGVRVVLLLPALGLALAAAGALVGLRRARLLRHGGFAMGERVSATPTNARIDRRRVHALVYRFVDAGGVERTATTKSHRFDPATTSEPLLASADGTRIVRLADLPVAPRFDRDGQLEPPPFRALALALLPPTLAAVGWALLQTFAA